MTPRNKVLTALTKVGMGTPNHLQPWIAKRAVTLYGSLQWPIKLIGQLEQLEMIKPLPVYPNHGKTFRFNTFYVPRGSSHKEIAYRELDHQSGLIDVLMAFFFLYPDYDIEIKYTPALKANGKTYRPDALVRLYDRNLKEYAFIIEFERTRGEKAIYDEKLVKNEQMPPFKSLGLPEQTKILYVYAHERQNVEWRPIEYDQPHIIQVLDLVNKRFANLIGKARKLPDHKYRFLPYHQFTRLNEPIWTTPKGNKVSLV